MSAAGVSVVIPAYNRGSVVGRAIDSCLRQGLAPLEVLVVDDASTDDTRAVVARRSAADSRVRLVALDSRQGGAAARNAGIAAARAPCIAFLDSDDEWLPTHLESKLSLLSRTGAALAFGAFYADDGRHRRLQPCAPLAGDPLEYLYGGGGGFRTSTFVCDAGRIREVGFDEALLKHQDWDLVVNVLARFPVATDAQATAVLHTGGADRMSAALNHEATERFIRKNLRGCSRNGWVLFATVMLERTWRTEGRSARFERYLALVRAMDPGAVGPIAAMTPLMRVPRIGGRLYRAATRRYCSATARHRPGLPAAGAA